MTKMHLLQKIRNLLLPIPHLNQYTAQPSYRKPVSSIPSSQQDIVDDDLASVLEFVETIYKENVIPTISHEQKKEQVLIQEISASNSQDDAFPSTQDHDSISPEYATEILLTSDQEKSNIFQNIANLYEKACDAEYKSIKANQAEILCWSNFIIVLDKSLDELIVRDKVSIKKAKGQVYDFIIAQNPSTRRKSLYKKIERARKIYRLFETIGLNKVKYIKSYSANAILKFTNEQIQPIINHFTKNPTKEFIDDQDNSSDDLPKTDVDEKALPKIEIKIVVSILKVSIKLIPPLCRENHMSLNKPRIPYDDVLKAYSSNLELIQELKTQCFTIPIPWNNALILPDKHQNHMMLPHNTKISDIYSRPIGRLEES
ncbi:hypothetical protein C2G38_2315099 [Gigaspora rosea]|uniref:Uncharacterized protein n=1 Tax=Gigaspora rosea TaxID=44941 RepID=A0A397VCH4_9GLOM|nr:hypothetical protein C2G38_2315099 [Gigaspora rosea]